MFFIETWQYEAERIWRRAATFYRIFQIDRLLTDLFWFGNRLFTSQKLKKPKLMKTEKNGTETKKIEPTYYWKILPNINRIDYYRNKQSICRYIFWNTHHLKIYK